jgi:hypothetical protein
MTSLYSRIWGIQPSGRLYPWIRSPTVITKSGSSRFVSRTASLSTAMPSSGPPVRSPKTTKTERVFLGRQREVYAGVAVGEEPRGVDHRFVGCVVLVGVPLVRMVGRVVDVVGVRLSRGERGDKQRMGSDLEAHGGLLMGSVWWS